LRTKYHDEQFRRDGDATMAYPKEIRRLATLPVDVEELCKEAAADGFRFMDRLRDDWKKGSNRFDGPGEIFLGIFQEQRLIAVGGLNIDPYIAAGHMGRLRHFYVLKRIHRQGVGTLLVRNLLDGANHSFSAVRLFTDTKDGAMFYEALGFVPSLSSTASHEMTLH
jgi:GNAT superfamily N-acetyltransferase